MTKKKIYIFTIGCLILLAPARSFAAAPFPIKLPYVKGQSFVVTQGYNSPPTHIKKDAYALDLTQNGCDAYGKAVVAAAPGKVMFLSQEGYNGGYGTELIIEHGDSIVSRYAHMVPDTILPAVVGTMIRRGQTIGLVGDTGLVAGLACAIHPGTHLHFAMDTVNSDGTFSAYNPEPISGYMGMTEGKWYLSDNDDDGGGMVTNNIANTTSPGATAFPANIILSAPAPVVTTTTNNKVLSGGVSIISPSVDIAPASIIPPTSTATPTPTASSTLDVSAGMEEASSSSSLETSSAAIASSSDILFQQSDDSINSNPSWYDDNWFQLGNGFSGTLNKLTLEGKVSDVNYLKSHIALDEFKDKNYTVPIQEFTISDNAPFTPTMATATFDGLSIPLKPYFYYRLSTIQDWQNRSVILAGTASTTVGTTMWDNFIYGTGRVESTSAFFPFITMEGVIATSTITPPPLTPPSNLAESFDELGMQLNLSWSTSTDPDWPANPLHYQINYSTSTSLSDASWANPSPIPLAIGNSYLIGIRAADNYGAVSAVTTGTWNFPAGFTPYLLSRPTGYAYQYFTVPSTSTLQSIEIFTTNVQTSARFIESVGCSMQLFDEDDLSSLGMTPSDNGFGGFGCAGGLTFSFASSSPVLYPSHQYQWVFTAGTGNPSTGASVQFYGTATNTAGGLFNDPLLVNAKFKVSGDSGVMFSN